MSSSEVAGNQPDDLFTTSACVCCGSEVKGIVYPVDAEHPSRLSGIDVSGVGLGVVVCPNCGHEFIQPLPKPEFLNAYYANYMSQAKSGFYRARSGETIPGGFRLHYGKWLEVLDELSAKKGRLMDVGAGLGMFLRLAREYGFEVEGVEPNVEAADTLEKSHAIKVHNDLFENVETRDRVDILTMWDLLEHLAMPRQALKKAQNLLQPEGLLVLEIPARDSLLHLLAKFLYRVSGGGIKRPLFLVCGLHHLNYFSEPDICRLLADVGFEVRRVYRGETELASLFRRGTGIGRIKAYLFNFSLVGVLFVARMMRRQNKMIIFAQKA